MQALPTLPHKAASMVLHTGSRVKLPVSILTCLLTVWAMYHIHTSYFFRDIVLGAELALTSCV